MAYNGQVKMLYEAGKFDEAIEMAKYDFSRDPKDEWCKRNLGLAYYKAVKSFINEKNFDKALKHLAEFDMFGIENEFIEKIRLYANPIAQIVIDAEKESKSNNHAKALSLYRKALIEFPDDEKVNTGLGWEIKKEIELVSKNFDASDLNMIRKLLFEFLKLKIEKPSRLYSTVLFYAEKMSDSFDKFPFFVKEWGLENLDIPKTDSHISNNVW